jgi:hypothetical protein
MIVMPTPTPGNLTWWEYAVVRAFQQLEETAKTRELTPAEFVSRDHLEACVYRYMEQEAGGEYLMKRGARR